MTAIFTDITTTLTTITTAIGALAIVAVGVVVALRSISMGKKIVNKVL